MGFSNKKTTCLAVLVAVLGSGYIFSPCVQAEDTSDSTATDTVSESEPTFYTVDQYDPRRDPLKDFQETAEKASDENKLVLIQIGGNWCGWCHVLSRTFENDSDIQTELLDNYLLMKVSVDDQNSNQEFLSLLPQVRAFPYLFVVKSDGTLLASMDPTPFETPRGYRTDQLLAFLKKWTNADEEE